MKRGNRPRRVGLLLALLVLAAIVTGVAASATNTVVPKQLIGEWVGNRAPVSMVVSSRGRVEIYEIAVDHAKFSRLTAHRLRISGIRSCSGTGTYRWTMMRDFGGDRLTFEKIHDPCEMRVGLLTGDHWGRVN